MSDITIGERFYRASAVGDIQAWAASAKEVSVAFGQYARLMHTESPAAYTCNSLNMTAADARSLAAVLIAAADYADEHRVAEAGDGVVAS